MALVAALPARRDELDPRLLLAAVRPGRVRGIGVALLGACLADPPSAEGLVRDGLRDARALHSRERRLVGDAIAGVHRHGRLLALAAGADDAGALWDAWLVASGLPVEAGGPARAADLAALLPEDPVARVGLLANVDAVGARALLESVADVEGFVAASNRRAPVAIRVNRARGDREALRAELARADVVARPAALAPDGLVLDGRPNLREGRWRGRFEAQDEGSQAIVELVDPSGPVLDWCAGAGGKSLAIASRWPDARLLSLDVRAHALRRLEERARAAGARLRTRLLPETGPVDLPAEAATVLVDAPCSGSGVWRRHPSYRFRASGPQLDALDPTQADVLRRAAAHVRPGGRLIYATCSVLRREDEQVVEAFLAERPDYALTPVAAVAPALPSTGAFLRLWPQAHDTDGFFAAVLTRRP